MKKQLKFPDFNKQVESLEFDLKHCDGTIWEKSYLDPWWEYRQVVINIVIYSTKDVNNSYDKLREIYLKHDKLDNNIRLDVNFWVKNNNNYYLFRFSSLSDLLNKETLEGPLDPDIYEIIPNDEMPRLW